MKVVHRFVHGIIEYMTFNLSLELEECEISEELDQCEM